MDLSAADIFRQTMATSTFQNVGRETAPAEAAKAAPERGAAMGFALQVEADPVADLMDSMEELSFQFEEKAMKKVSERKLGEARGTQSAFAKTIDAWMKTLPDMPGADFLRRAARMLRASAQFMTPQDLLRLLGEGSRDPSHQFAMLDALEQYFGEGGEGAIGRDAPPPEVLAKLRQIISQTRASLLAEKGAEVRAGINIAEEVNARAGGTGGTLQELRDLYRGEVLGFSTPQACFRSLLASRGPAGLGAAIDFLAASCGCDLQAADPSMPPEELRRIMLDLQCVSVLRSMLGSCDKLAERMGAQFGENCLLNGQQLAGRVVDLTEQPFVSAGNIASLVSSAGIQELLAQSDFTRELVGLFRGLSSRLFAKESDRIRLVDAGQEHLDGIVSLLEEEEEKEQESRS